VGEILSQLLLAQLSQEEGSSPGKGKFEGGSEEGESEGEESGVEESEGKFGVGLGDSKGGGDGAL